MTRPTSELIAESRAAVYDIEAWVLLPQMASRLSSILRAWEAYIAAPYHKQGPAIFELECAITGTSTEVRG